MSMTVEAKYIGGDETKGYMVNVRNAHPKGMIGDAGYIRRFETDKAAKAFTALVNETGEDFYQKEQLKPEKPIPLCHIGDDFVKAETCEDCEDVECPKISWGRATFSRLTDEQIKAINETRKLPEGVKIVRDGMCGYTLSNSYKGLVTGTRTVPEGFEMKKDWLGFTVVVPKDTESIFINDVA